MYFSAMQILFLCVAMANVFAMDLEVGVQEERAIVMRKKVQEVFLTVTSPLSAHKDLDKIIFSSFAYLNEEGIKSLRARLHKFRELEKSTAQKRVDSV